MLALAVFFFVEQKQMHVQHTKANIYFFIP